MRWQRLVPVAGSVLLLGVLAAGPAAAQPDHLHVDLSLVSCGTLKATGYHLPARTRLDLRFVDAASGATLRQATVPTGADGSLELTATLALTNVRTIRMTVSRPGAARPFAFSEMSIPGACPLPFTGPARWPALTGTALGLLLAGSLLVRLGAGRGRRGTGGSPARGA